MGNDIFFLQWFRGRDRSAIQGRGSKQGERSGNILGKIGDTGGIQR